MCDPRPFVCNAPPAKVIQNTNTHTHTHTHTRAHTQTPTHPHLHTHTHTQWLRSLPTSSSALADAPESAPSRARRVLRPATTRVCVCVCACVCVRVCVSCVCVRFQGMLCSVPRVSNCLSVPVPVPLRVCACWCVRYPLDLFVSSLSLAPPRRACSHTHTPDPQFQTLQHCRANSVWIESLHFAITSIVKSKNRTLNIHGFAYEPEIASKSPRFTAKISRIL